jgi:ParB family chromosome partitioning protein
MLSSINEPGGSENKVFICPITNEEAVERVCGYYSKETTTNQCHGNGSGSCLSPFLKSKKQQDKKTTPPSLPQEEIKTRPVGTKSTAKVFKKRTKTPSQKEIEIRLADTELTTETSKSGDTARVVQTISIDSIRPYEDQPRKYFDESALKALADSIKQNGLQQPIIVMKLSNSADGKKYELIDGERRFRAHIINEQTEILAIVVETLDEKQQYLKSVVSNFLREGHHPIETAHVIKRFINDNYSQEYIGKLLGKSAVWVGYHLRLLSLDSSVQEMMRPDLGHSNPLSVTTATLLAGFPVEEQMSLAKYIQDRKLDTKDAASFLRKTADAKNIELSRGRKKMKPSYQIRIFRAYLRRVSRDGDRFLGEHNGQNIMSIITRSLITTDHEDMRRIVKEAIEVLTGIQRRL